MKKVFLNIFIILFIGIIVVGCGKKQQPIDLYDVIKQRGHLVVGVDSTVTPFCYKDEDGNFVGFEVDLAKKIAELIMNDANAIEFVKVDSANRISMLNSGQADIIIATMTITNKRLSMVDFSQPYYVAGQTVMVNNSSKIKSLSDFKNKKIGTVFGTTANDGIRVVAPSSLITGFKTYEEAISALKNGDIDGVASDDTVLRSFTLKDKSLKLINQKYTQEPYGIAFRKGNESTRVLNMVNVMLEDMSNCGELSKLKSRWVK